MGEAGQHDRVKDPARAVPDHPDSLPQRVGGLIDSGVEQGVKGVRQTHHLHPGSNVPSSQAVRVAGAVPSLMVVAADVTNQRKGLALLERWNVLQKLTALGGMGFHHFKLILSETPGLVEDLRGDGLLSNIMERGQGGVKLCLLHRQRGDGAGGRECGQQADCKVLKLGAVERAVREKPSRRRRDSVDSMFNSIHLVR